MGTACPYLSAAVSSNLDDVLCFSTDGSAYLKREPGQYVFSLWQSGGPSYFACVQGDTGPPLATGTDRYETARLALIALSVRRRQPALARALSALDWMSEEYGEEKDESAIAELESWLPMLGYRVPEERAVPVPLPVIIEDPLVSAPAQMLAELPEIGVGLHIARAALRDPIRIALVGKMVDVDQMRRVLFAEPGLERAVATSTRRCVKLNNGTKIDIYGLDEPERLRGVQTHITWVAGKAPSRVYDLVRYMTRLGKFEIYVL